MAEIGVEGGERVASEGEVWREGSGVVGPGRKTSPLPSPGATRSGTSGLPGPSVLGRHAVIVSETLYRVQGPVVWFKDFGVVDTRSRRDSTRATRPTFGGPKPKCRRVSAVDPGHSTDC